MARLKDCKVEKENRENMQNDLHENTIGIGPRAIRMIYNDILRVNSDEKGGKDVPGAQQRSRTLSPGSTPRALTAAALLTSIPYICPKIGKLMLKNDNYRRKR